MKRTRTPPPAFQIGQRVKLPLGSRTVIGEIVEDRGPFGGGGQRIYQIEVPQEPDDPLIVLRDEGDLEAAPATPPPVLDMAKVKEYLLHGGLYSMLLAESPGGKNQPRAWLCLDTFGNITHTFRPERGILGGATVPYGAIREGKVFPPKKDEVVTFLNSFGLSPKEAEAVIAAVGTMA
jgi:hypothetical protein